jgi:hypothetical protein
MPAAHALENRRYTSLDDICSELFGVQNTGHKKSAPIPKG